MVDQGGKFVFIPRYSCENLDLHFHKTYGYQI